MAALLAALSPGEAVARKVSAGGTGPAAVEQQIASLRRQVVACEARAAVIPSLDSIGQKLREVTL
jgi:argininosuccinate lyase